MRDELQHRLLGEYAIALLAEQEAWQVLRDPVLDDAVRLRQFGKWKLASQRVKSLARQLRDTSASAAPASCRAWTEDSLARAERETPPPIQVATEAATQAAQPASGSPPRLPRGRWISPALRLLAISRDKLESAVPRLFSH